MTLRDIIAALIGAGLSAAVTTTVRLVNNSRSKRTSYTQKNITAGGDVVGRDKRGK
jgi:hypothetical protein